MAITSGVYAIGNLVADVDLREIVSSGKAVASFTIAVNERKKVGDEYEDDPSFLDCIVWDTLAKNCAETLNKGMRVVVVGRVKQNRWETPEGDKRSKIEFVVEAVGPDLRWASANVERNERNPDFQTPAAREATKAKPAATKGDPGPQPPPDELDYDDSDSEPFIRDAGEWLPGAWGEYPNRVDI